MALGNRQIASAPIGGQTGTLTSPNARIVISGQSATPVVALCHITSTPVIAVSGVTTISGITSATFTDLQFQSIISAVAAIPRTGTLKLYSDNYLRVSGISATPSVGTSTIRSEEDGAVTAGSASVTAGIGNTYRYQTKIIPGQSAAPLLGGYEIINTNIVTTHGIPAEPGHGIATPCILIATGADGATVHHGTVTMVSPTLPVAGIGITTHNGTTRTLIVTTCGSITSPPYIGDAKVGSDAIEPVPGFNAMPSVGIAVILADAMIYTGSAFQYPDIGYTVPVVNMLQTVSGDGITPDLQNSWMAAYQILSSDILWDTQNITALFEPEANTPQWDVSAPDISWTVDTNTNEWRNAA